MLTTFGLFFLLICVIGFYRPVSYMFCVLIVSSIFQAAAVINVGNRGIPPFLVAELFLIAKSIHTYSIYIPCYTSKYILYILLFFCFSTSVTIVMPFIFEGIPVISPNVDNNDCYTPLTLSLKNLYYVLTMAIHVLVFICISNVSKYMGGLDIVRLMTTIVIVVSIIGFWEWTAKISHTYLFPNEFFYCNKGYEQYWLQGFRLNSTFTEASYAGAFLSSALAYLIYIRSKTVIIVIASVALVLNMSGTGIVAFGISLFVLFLIDRHLRKYALLFVMAFLLFVYLVDYKELILEMLLNKSSSQSGVERSSTVLYTLGLIKDTYLMGVGLGSHRCLSFFTGLLAAVGLIGTILLGMFVYELLLKIFVAKNRNYRGVVVFGGTMFIAQCIAIPDLTTPFFWMWLFLAAYIVENNKINKVKKTLLLSCLWRKNMSVLMPDS